MMSRRLQTNFGIAHMDATVNISHYTLSRIISLETIGRLFAIRQGWNGLERKDTSRDTHNTQCRW